MPAPISHSAFSITSTLQNCKSNSSATLLENDSCDSTDTDSDVDCLSDVSNMSPKTSKVNFHNDINLLPFKRLKIFYFSFQKALKWCHYELLKEKLKNKKLRAKIVKLQKNSSNVLFDKDVSRKQIESNEVLLFYYTPGSKN